MHTKTQVIITVSAKVLLLIVVMSSNLTAFATQISRPGEIQPILERPTPPPPPPPEGLGARESEVATDVAPVIEREPVPTRDMPTREAELDRTERERQIEAQRREQQAALEARQAAIQEQQTERIEAIETRQTAMEERRQEILANQAERRAALTTRTQERIMNLAANVSNRMEAALRRLESVATRLATRLDILTERGIDTETARSQLAEAERHIAAAYQTLATIDEQVANAVLSENPRRSWETVRTTYQQAQMSIRAAHQALRDTVATTNVALTDVQATEDTTE